MNLPKPSLLTQEWADNMANPDNQGIIAIDIGLIFDYLYTAKLDKKPAADQDSRHVEKKKEKKKKKKDYARLGMRGLREHNPC